QPVPRPTAPEEIGADDEPDEQVERAGPGAPREAVGPSGLDHEQRSLREPPESHTPRREPSGSTRPAGVPGVRDRRLAVGEQRWPEQQLSQSPPLLARAPPAASP